jgi:Tfp pilus assembly protein PilZ
VPIDRAGAVVNVVARFREYMHLECKRTDGGLSPMELARWTLLKRELGRDFTPGISDERSDQRRSLRVPAKVPVSVDSMDELRECLMTNLSRGGLFLATPHLVEIGTRLDLILRVEGEAALEIPVEVVSHNLGPRLASCQQGMGMRFLEMSSQVRQRVDDLYERAGLHAVRNCGALIDA